MMKYLQSNRLIKVRFPNILSQGHWTIEEKSSKTIHAVPLEAVLMTVKCSQCIGQEDLLQYIYTKTAMETQELEAILDYLLEKKIIYKISRLSKINTAVPSSLTVIKEWEKAGWEDAMHYHSFTWDAPFLDYSKEGGGHEKGDAKMLAYSKIEPDNKRCKQYNRYLDEFNLPAISNLSEESDTVFQDMTFGDRLKYLLVIALGKSGEIARSWTNTPLMRRTSPSGGSRHPTEGYLLVCNIEGLAPGWYHIQADPPKLALISPQHPFDSSVLEPQASHSAGMIILTSCFERTMYRYRNPYVFRIAHMDAGYMLNTIETLGKALGIRTHSHLNVNEEFILKKIGASLFQEGVMAAINVDYC